MLKVPSGRDKLKVSPSASTTVCGLSGSEALKVAESETMLDRQNTAMKMLWFMAEGNKYLFIVLPFVFCPNYFAKKVIGNILLCHCCFVKVMLVNYSRFYD